MKLLIFVLLAVVMALAIDVGLDALAYAERTPNHIFSSDLITLLAILCPAVATALLAYVMGLWRDHVGWVLLACAVVPLLGYVLHFIFEGLVLRAPML
jgi:hypothetical protein